MCIYTIYTLSIVKYCFVNKYIFIITPHLVFCIALYTYFAEENLI